MKPVFARMLLAPLVLATLAAVAAIDPASAACIRGVEAGDTLRVRSGPGASYSDLGGVPPGACDVEMRGACRRGWCPVGYAALTGWANAKFLDRATRTEKPASINKAPDAFPPPSRPSSASGSTVCVRDLPQGQPLKVRASPSPTAALLYGFLEGSCGVAITGDCVNGFCPITYRGYSGWADSRYLH